MRALRTPCPECGQFNARHKEVCDLCGAMLVSADAAPVPRREERMPVVHVYRDDGEPVRTTLKYVLIGVALAPVFTFTPLLRYMGWFLSSLVHEIGHCVAGWALGCPSFPAIRIDGHAAAVHSPQVFFLCLIFWGILLWLAWSQRERKPLLWLFGAAALLYPLFAFTGLRDFAFLLAGHFGELAFAAVFLWRGLVGGFTQNPIERVGYITLGTYLVGGNIWLSGGLLFDEGVRVWYHGSGSFGLTNDYIRVSRDVLGVGLGLVAFFMLLVSLAVPVLVWMIARPGRVIDHDEF